MPLSEHEQRILAELEESLVRHDPAFVERVRAETVHRHAGRRCKWAVAGFLAGLTILVAFYSQSVGVGLFGVAVMFGSAVAFERNFRRMGGTAWHGDRPPDAPEGDQHGTREWFRTHLFRRQH